MGDVVVVGYDGAPRARSPGSSAYLSFEQVHVPNLKHKTLAEAKTLLKQATCRLSNI